MPGPFKGLIDRLGDARARASTGSTTCCPAAARCVDRARGRCSPSSRGWSRGGCCRGGCGVAEQEAAAARGRARRGPEGARPPGRRGRARRRPRDRAAAAVPRRAAAARPRAARSTSAPRSPPARSGGRCARRTSTGSRPPSTTWSTAAAHPRPRTSPPRASAGPAVRRRSEATDAARSARPVRARASSPCWSRFGIVLAVVDRLAPQPKGPKSSSYATSPQGLAAYAAVLERNGHPVRRAAARRSPTSRRATARRWSCSTRRRSSPRRRARSASGCRAGGHAGRGRRDRRVLARRGARRRRRSSTRTASSTTSVLAPVPRPPASTQVRSAGNGAWDELGGALPVIGPRRRAAGRHRAGGRGQRRADRRRLAAEQPRASRAPTTRRSGSRWSAARAPVAFLETVHGYGVSRGFGGLPTNVKWTLLGLALTAIVAAWAAGRRFGPTEDPDTPLPPPRVEYVEARRRPRWSRTKEEDAR